MTGGVVAWQPGDGHFHKGAVGDFESGDGWSVLMRRARSKHDAGRLLDGREWNEYPTSEPVVSR